MIFSHATCSPLNLVHLSGDLIELRSLQPNHFDDLFACASDPEIWRDHPQPDRYEKENFQQFFTKALDSKGAFVIIDVATKKVIGSSRFYDFDGRKKSIKIGYTFLAKAYWGGQYNRELKTLMLQHAFQHVDTVYFEVGENNIRSRKAMEKIGAQFLEHIDLNGQPYALYSIDKIPFQRN